jgi:GNAT superfamily N-acetyltransferase
MQRPQKDADHDARIIRDPLDDFGLLFGAWRHEVCIGTLRVNLLRDGDIGDYRQMYQLTTLTRGEADRTSITTRMMVLPDARRRGVSIALASAAAALAPHKDITTDYIDCNDHLVPFFEHLGYVPHCPLVHPEYGRVTVMSVALDDDAHLDAVGSPFLRRGGRRVTSAA